MTKKTDEEQFDFLKAKIKLFEDFKEFTDHKKLISILSNKKYLKPIFEDDSTTSIGWDIVMSFCPAGIDDYIFYKYTIGDLDDESDGMVYTEGKIYSDFVPFRHYPFTIIPELIDKCSEINCSKIMEDHSFGEYSDLYLLESKADNKYFIMWSGNGEIEESPQLLHISDVPISNEIIEEFKKKASIVNFN